MDSISGDYCIYTGLWSFLSLLSTLRETYVRVSLGRYTAEDNISTTYKHWHKIFTEIKEGN